MDKKIPVCLLLTAGLLAGCGNQRAGDRLSPEDAVSVSYSQAGTESIDDTDSMISREEQMSDENGDVGNIYVETIYNMGPLIVKASNSLDGSVRLEIGRAGEEAADAVPHLSSWINYQSSTYPVLSSAT